MNIEDKTLVTMNYTVTDVAGTVIDSSTDRPPLEFVFGLGQIIPGLEQGVAGHQAGDHLEVDVAAADAYGVFDPELEITVPLEAFPPEAREQLEPGMRFQGQHPIIQGRLVIYQVQDLVEESIRASGNHPLAGKDLHFVIDVVAVRAATPEELQGACGCCAGGCGDSCGGDDCDCGDNCSCGS